MPKGPQNDDKMDAKIYVFAYFFSKGENARNYCIYNRKRGSGHSKKYAKSMQNRCQKKPCKKYGKVCQNGPQMEAQIVRKIENMRKKTSKMTAEKTYDFWKGPGGDFDSPRSP